MQSLKACIIKLWSAQVFCLKAFTPPDTPLIIFYTNVSAHKVTKPEVYCLLIYSLYTGMKWITPFPLNCHDSWTRFTQMTRTKPAQRLIKRTLTVNLVVGMMELERQHEGVVTLVVTCFIEDGLIHSALTPSSLVNINVSVLCRRPFPPSHTSADKSH